MPVASIRFRRAVWAIAVAMSLASPAAAGDPTIFAAASLKTALDDVIDEWSAATGHRAVVSYAGSSALARQIEAGAPADIFISANPGWMDLLETRGLIRPATRVDLLANRLVLISHAPNPAPLNVAPGFDLAGRLGDGRLATALVDAVPAGIYAKSALIGLGVWNDVADRIAQMDNVRAALALVARGEAPLGIVYVTDAMAEPGVTVVAMIPAAVHPPIVYPAALVADSTAPLASALLDFIAGTAARATFRRHGFESVD